MLTYDCSIPDPLLNTVYAKTTTHTLKSFSFSYDTVSLTLLNQKKGFSFLYKLFLRNVRKLTILF